MVELIGWMKSGPLRCRVRVQFRVAGYALFSVGGDAIFECSWAFVLLSARRTRDRAQSPRFCHVAAKLSIFSIVCGIRWGLLAARRTAIR